MSNIIKYVNQTSTPSIASAATAIAANTTGNREGLVIQNLGTNPLFVLLGSGASTTVFSFVLKGGTGNDDGNGGLFSMLGGDVWQGIVTIAGTSPRYVAWEIA